MHARRRKFFFVYIVCMCARVEYRFIDRLLPTSKDNPCGVSGVVRTAYVRRLIRHVRTDTWTVSGCGQ